MTRSLLLFSLLWLGCSSDGLSQYSTMWSGAKLDTLTSGNSDEFNPALQKNSYYGGLSPYCWLLFERHTSTSSDIVAKRFLTGALWDTASILIAASSSTAEQTRPCVAGLVRKPFNAVAAWQRKTGSIWNVYYAFYLADSLRWQSPQALTADSVDCYDVHAFAYSDTSFTIAWKRRNSILFTVISPRYRSVVDTAASSNTDSTEYDLGGGTYGRNSLVLFTQKDSTGTRSLWERVFLPDSLRKPPSPINTNGLSAFHPRYVQYSWTSESWFTFDAYNGNCRDIWGIDDAGLSQLTLTPLIDERKCSMYFFPIVIKQSSITLASAFARMKSAYEADSTIILNPGNSVITSTGYNRAPVLNGYILPEIGPYGERIIAVWESNRSGRSHLYSKHIFESPGSVSRESYEPAGYTLSQNYPNPFNPATTFRFSIPASQVVSMKIFDILGREVAMLVNERLDAGSYRVDWNTSEQTSGTYFAVLKTASHSETKKIVLLK